MRSALSPKGARKQMLQAAVGASPKGSAYQAHAQSFQRSCDRKLMPLHLPTAENNTDFARALIAQQRVPDIQCNRVITTLFAVHAEQRLVKRPMCNNQTWIPVPQDKRWAFPARIHLRLTEGPRCNVSARLPIMLAPTTSKLPMNIRCHVFQREGATHLHCGCEEYTREVRKCQQSSGNPWPGVTRR